MKEMKIPEDVMKAIKAVVEWSRACDGAKVLDGNDIPLNEHEAALFRQRTGRSQLPDGPMSRLLLLASPDEILACTVPVLDEWLVAIGQID
jgi:hypothetical protein